jgi:hypothetical protein
MEYENNFNQNLPYKIVEVIEKDVVSYKIVQQKKHWLFGLSKKYYAIFERASKPYVRYDTLLFFRNKNRVEEFVKKNTFKIHYRETIVEEK